VNITVKAGGLLYEYLPAGRNGNRARLQVADGATAADVMRQLGLPTGDSYLVIVNGELLAQELRASVSLKEGDQLSINPPLRGG